MQRLQRNPDAILIAVQRTQSTVEKKLSALDQRHTVIPEAADANFRTLQVAHNSDFAASRFCGTAQ